MKSWRDAIILGSETLRGAIERIDSAGHQIALICDSSGILEGILTDTDVRRAILREQSLDTPVSEAMNRAPFTMTENASREAVMEEMRLRHLTHVPIVNKSGFLIELYYRNNMPNPTEQGNAVVIMAGGLGKRLRPLTESFPKPMLPVNGKPILEIILERFRDQGFKRIFLAVNYRAELIKSHFQNGEKFGLEIKYLEEEEKLGTAGALGLLNSKEELPILIANGDVLTKVDYRDLLNFHREQNASATMAIREYDMAIPFGVVKLDDAQITAIDEKPTKTFYVNSGMYVLEPGVVSNIPKNKPLDMPTLFAELRHKNQKTVGFPLREYWIDIGQLDQLQKAEQEW